jgi:hypothetical protein
MQEWEQLVIDPRDHDGTDWEPRLEGLAQVSAPERNKAWLAEARTYAADWLAGHPGAHITTDDVRHAVPPELWGVTSNNVIGAVFRDRRFVSDGWHESKDQKAHSRVARTWILSDA